MKDEPPHIGQSEGVQREGRSLDVQGGQEWLMEKVGLKGLPKNEGHSLDPLERGQGTACMDLHLPTQ